MCEIVHALALDGIDLIPSDQWNEFNDFGVPCSLAVGCGLEGDHAHGTDHDSWVQVMRHKIDSCATAHVATVMTTWVPPRDSTDMYTTVTSYQQLLRTTDGSGVMIAIEPPLDATLMGMESPGQACLAAIELVAELVNRVGSDRLGIVLDLGTLCRLGVDVMYVAKRYANLVNHLHSAGNINDPSMRSIGKAIELLAARGFNGFLAHEFVPAMCPLEDLTGAVNAVRKALCMNNRVSEISSP
jgi:sugar phosphate isomerase/epimerase